MTTYITKTNKIDDILSDKGGCDKKCKVNRLNQSISDDFLNQLESGVTLENLDTMTKNGLPVFKYQTQITVHGIFNQLSVFRIGGYKNLFQNKNKSIGVKYNAIDYAKKRRLSTVLSCKGFFHVINSTDNIYRITWRCDTQEKLDQAITDAKTIYNNIDTGLFYGGRDLWRGAVYGRTYIILDISLNAIYEANIKPFYNKLGITDTDYSNKLQEIERKKQERKEQDIINKKEREQKAIEAEANKKIIIAQWEENGFIYYDGDKYNGLHIVRPSRFSSDAPYTHFIYMKYGKRFKVFTNKTTTTDKPSINGATWKNPTKYYNDNIKGFIKR
jgi:hypothetical protein